MAKTKNISLRLDEDDLKLASEATGINKPQKLIDFLLSEYAKPFKKSPPKEESYCLKIIIYSLINPTNNEVFYVGKTINTLEQRLKAHLKESQDNVKSEKREVIKSITSIGLHPIANELECYECSCPEDELKINEREKYWIEFYSKTAKNVIGIKQLYKNKSTIKNFNPPPSNNFEIKKQKRIEAILAEKIPEHRNTRLGRLSWQIEQKKRITAIENEKDE